jgi:hypothetical protein
MTCSTLSKPTVRRAKARKRVSGGGSPRNIDEQFAAGIVTRQRTSCSTLSKPTSDSGPSEARKRVSGGGSPRKMDERVSES